MTIKTIHSRDVYPHLHPNVDSGLPLIKVSNPLASAVIALQGAHVLAFQPTARDEMLWVSPKAVLQQGVPVRGGIPICLPWFARDVEGGPMHGFARTSEWRLQESSELASGATRLLFELSGDESVCSFWPHAFVFQLEIIVGSTLEMKMVVENRSTSTAPLSFAFHTYFAVPDVAQTQVLGLEGMRYADKVEAGVMKQQDGAVTINGRTDRIYYDVPALQQIKWGQSTVNVQSASTCSVVWNAGEIAGEMPDIGAGNQVSYLCVERGDMGDRCVSVPAGASYECQMTLSYA